MLVVSQIIFISGENIIVGVQTVAAGLVSGFTGQTGGSRVARDKGATQLSSLPNRSGAPKNLHRDESGPHGPSAWQTRGPNLLGPNNGTEFKRCICPITLFYCSF